MLFGKFSQAALLSLAFIFDRSSALYINGGRMNVHPDRRDGDGLQNLVTWDSHSIFVRGERVMFYSGEFHPFRLPVPSLWLDVFQKIKALGYNGVSFYTDWALLEGKQGDFSAEGIFDLEPFFDAAKTAGIYLLARPGPYINAEASGGGFPGWLQRNKAPLRTRDPGYLDATKNYVNSISKIIAKAQITEGGPVILLQPENEYTEAAPGDPYIFPDPVYFQYVEDQYRNNSIVVPLISNDAYAAGHFADGPPRQPAAVNIYGHDGYPLGFDCADPYTWPAGYLPTNYGYLHQQQSSSTPYSIVEFQGGSFDSFGGSGFEKCVELLGPEFERVFYFNDFSFGVKVFNIYMTYGGTNWGNLGHPYGYTSYDYGAAIAEDRDVAREKYSEAKLLANFIQASPAYLTASYQDNSNGAGAYTGNDDIFTTAVLGNVTNFYVVRHSAYQSDDTTSYKITLPTSKGNLTLPQISGTLSLHGRDSKMLVTDYDVGGLNLLYSTANIFTWKKTNGRRVLIVYSGPGETNEFAIANPGKSANVVGSGVTTKVKDGYTIVNWSSSTERRIIRFGKALHVYILDRQAAYNYWVIDAPNDPVTGNYTSAQRTSSAPIIKAGYLVRTASVSGREMHLTGDINATTDIEIISGAPSKLTKLTWNSQPLKFRQLNDDAVLATVTYIKPSFTLPDLSTVGWKVVDSLPEIKSSYDDSLWTTAYLTYSNNTAYNLSTPRSLFASDYGYNTGYLLYRGQFTAKSASSSFYLHTQGGVAFGHSAWLNGTYVGSFAGDPNDEDYNSTYTLSDLEAGKPYVITILIDNMGLDENGDAGDSGMKNPRGILNYSLSGYEQSDISWKLTGNLGGEDYLDRARGPLNEGGLWAERQGYHLPGAPIDSWKSSKSGPVEGVSGAGVAFYATDITLDMPNGYDIPLAFTFTNSTAADFRAMIFVNGYQFGKYVNNIGPQTSFPVPQGILNYQGVNRIAVSVWSQESGGVQLGGFALESTGALIQTGYGDVALSPMPGWTKRPGAY